MVQMFLQNYCNFQVTIAIRTNQVTIAIFNAAYKKEAQELEISCYNLRDNYYLLLAKKHNLKFVEASI